MDTSILARPDDTSSRVRASVLHVCDNVDTLATHGSPIKDSDQTARMRMRKLI